MLEIVTIILQIIAALLPFVIDWKEEAPQRRVDDNVQDARKALAKGDTDRLAVLAADQHDRVLDALRRSPRR